MQREIINGMDISKIIGLGLIAYALFFKKDSDNNSGNNSGGDGGDGDDSNVNNLVVVEDTSTPAEKYLQVTPRLEFNTVRTHDWNGKFTWVIKNTSKDYYFTILGAKANYIIGGYIGNQIPATINAVRIAPGKTVEMVYVNNTARWYRWNEQGNVTGQIESHQSGQWQHFNNEESDVELFVTGTGSTKPTTVTFANLPLEMRHHGGTGLMTPKLGVDESIYEDMKKNYEKDE